MARAVEAVIFDLDGVLVDTDDSIVLTFQQVFRDAGLRVPSREKILSVKSIGGRRIIESLIARGRAADPEFVAAMHAAYTAISRARLGEVREMPGARPLLCALKKKGLKLAVATNRGATANELLFALGLNGYFDAVITSRDVKNLKPDPEPLLAALEALGIQKGAALFVGDSAVDAEAGQAAGIKTILFLKEGGSDSTAPGAAGIARTLGEVEEWVI